MTETTRAQEYARFDVLDFYRYAGALFIALDHFLLLYLPADVWITDRIHVLLQPLMGFFFTLSGFVIMHVYGRHISTIADYFDYLQKRLARIYPLHLATFVLAMLWGIYSGHKYFFSSNAILPNIFLLHAWDTTDHLSFNYPSWSVSAEFFVYLLFPVFLFVTNRLGLWWALLLPLMCVIANILFFNARGLGPWTQANYDFGCLRAVPSFIAGMVVYRLATVRFAHLVVPGWTAHGLAIATIPMMLVGVPNELVLAIMVLVVFLLARAEPVIPGTLSKPLPRALANCSYGFYMLHALVGGMMLSLVPKVIYLSDAWKYGMAAAAILVTTMTAIISFRFFENPARRYFGSLRFRRTKAVIRF